MLDRVPVVEGGSSYGFTMNPMKYVLKHAKCDLYVAEQAGSWSRWGKRDEAMEKTMPEWEAALSPDLDRELVEFEKAS